MALTDVSHRKDIKMLAYFKIIFSKFETKRMFSNLETYWRLKMGKGWQWKKNLYAISLKLFDDLWTAIMSQVKYELIAPGLFDAMCRLQQKNHTIKKHDSSLGNKFQSTKVCLQKRVAKFNRTFSISSLKL